MKKNLKLILAAFTCNIVGINLFLFIFVMMAEHKISLFIDLFLSSLFLGGALTVPEIILIFLFYYLQIQITYWRIFIVAFFMINIFYPPWIESLFFDLGEYLAMSAMIFLIIATASWLFNCLVKRVTNNSKQPFAHRQKNATFFKQTSHCLFIIGILFSIYFSFNFSKIEDYFFFFTTTLWLIYLVAFLCLWTYFDNRKII